jgi:hypothetical protein
MPKQRNTKTPDKAKVEATASRRKTRAQGRDDANAARAQANRARRADGEPTPWEHARALRACARAVDPVVIARREARTRRRRDATNDV